MEGDYEELYKWIEEHTISRPKRNINRDFADAVPLVEILKQHFPKLVEIHNYSPRNSYAQKLINWETLNNKVLKKIKITLTKKRIDQLAKGEPGAIEKLLSEVKHRIETRSPNGENCEVYYVDGQNDFSGKIQNDNTKRMSWAAIEQMQSELSEKSEAVTTLRNKVNHLENLLNIKEERIKDLSIQLQSIVNQPTRPDSGQSSKFFGFFQSANVTSETVKNEM